MKPIIMTKKQLNSLVGEYIFHGSPKLFEICKPHQATCESKNSDNEKNAIYGTNELDFAVVFAFEKLPLNGCHWRVVHVGDRCIAELDKDTYIDANSKGYLYCFNKNKFKQVSVGSRQYICEEIISPDMVVKLQYKDFKNLFVSVDFSKEIIK